MKPTHSHRAKSLNDHCKASNHTRQGLLRRLSRYTADDARSATAITLKYS